MPATRVDRVLIRDQLYHRHAGPRRYFWLLDEGVQLVYEPFGWVGEWYVDVVEIDTRGDAADPVYHVTDAYVDIVVEGMGPTYRMIDLDELAQAFVSECLDPTRVVGALLHAQRFVESYLHRGAPFPPPQIQRHFAADHHYPPLPRP
ncbi:DUF402 domain-containing protein [Micromonospora sp. WMMD1102]|uniref:DUF402 domain-containing protein n=1 Tax=Micromonospora sp. WMMD1102 TaxID=3016105 RepID=UPI00241587E8|nr:DUF402 domain-containing protein [Micromonospora sp. WMMD1102]MDG4788041.1 DUF402 domain-containing protein [Micromonospora sp. WMMD1102]